MITWSSVSVLTRYAAEKSRKNFCDFDYLKIMNAIVKTFFTF